MRPFLLVLAWFLVSVVPGCDRSSGQTQYPTSGSITFGNEQIESGAELTRTEHAFFEGRIRVGLRRIKATIQIEQTRHERFLAVRNGKPTYLVVTYPRARTTTTTRIGGSSTEAEPVENQTYRVWRVTSNRIHRQDRSTPSTEENATLIEDYTLASHPIETLDRMRGQTLRVGEELSSEMLTVMDFRDPKVTVRLVGEATHGGRSAAVFEVRMKGNEAGAKYDLEGIAMFDISTAALVRLTVEGPMTYKEPGGKARGTIKMDITHDYSFE